MLGEFLYRLTPQEARSAPVIQRVATLANPAAVAAVNVFFDFPPVPLDKVLVLTAVSIRCTAGAAQTVSRLAAVVIAQNGNVQQTPIFHYVPEVAQLTCGRSFNCFPQIVMPGEFIELAAGFSAGGVANTINECGYNGYFLPKGTLQVR